MRTVILYGHLAKKFGKMHRFDVRTPREAVAALSANFPQFRLHVLEHNEPGYHVRVGREFRDEGGLAYPADDAIRIIPALGGAGSVGRIILGVALIVLAPYAAGFIFANTTMVGLTITLATTVPKIGMALVIGGIAQMLTPTPKSQINEPSESKPSYAFDGPVNTVAQGNAVPVCFGRLIVGSQVISGGLDTIDIPV